MDGSVIAQAFVPDFLTARPVLAAPPPPTNGRTGGTAHGEAAPRAGVYSETEEDEVMRRLKDLGYV
jgi:hypothetical protein